MFWKHYKGGIYKILYDALDSTTLEKVIVYQDMRDQKKIWVRPEKEWSEVIPQEGSIKRFELLTETNCVHEYYPTAVNEPECKWCGYCVEK